MPRRRIMTSRLRAAMVHNLFKAQVSRLRTREPRSLGRVMRQRMRGSTIRRR